MQEINKHPLSNTRSPKNELKEVLPAILPGYIHQLVAPILDQVQVWLLKAIENESQASTVVESAWYHEVSAKGKEFSSEEEKEEEPWVLCTPSKQNTASLKKALEVVTLMRRKLLETIDHMSPEEQLAFIHSVHSLNTALMGYSPEQLQQSPEVTQLAALLMGMGQAQQCQYEDVCSQDYFPPIVNALSSTLAEHEIHFVDNPHVMEAIQSLEESYFQNQQLMLCGDGLYAIVKQLLCIRTSFLKKSLEKMEKGLDRREIEALIGERKDGYKRHTWYCASVGLLSSDLIPTTAILEKDERMSSQEQKVFLKVQVDNKLYQSAITKEVPKVQDSPKMQLLKKYTDLSTEPKQMQATSSMKPPEKDMLSLDAKVFPRVQGSDDDSEISADQSPTTEFVPPGTFAGSTLQSKLPTAIPAYLPTTATPQQIPEVSAQMDHTMMICTMLSFEHLSTTQSSDHILELVPPDAYQPQSPNESDESTSEELSSLLPELLRGLHTSDDGSHESVDSFDCVYTRDRSSARGVRDLLRPIGSGSSSSDHPTSPWRKPPLSRKQRKQRHRAEERVNNTRPITSESESSDGKVRKTRWNCHSIPTKHHSFVSDTESTLSEDSFPTTNQAKQSPNTRTTTKDEPSKVQLARSDVYSHPVECAEDVSRFTQQQKSVLVSDDHQTAKNTALVLKTNECMTVKVQEDRACETSLRNWLSGFIQEHGFSRLKQVIPPDHHFLYGLSPWRGTPISKSMVRQLTDILYVARHNRSAITRDAKQHLDDLAIVCRDIYHSDGSTASTDSDTSYYRGSDKRSSSKTSKGESQKNITEANKENVATPSGDSSQAADSGLLRTVTPKNVAPPTATPNTMPTGATATDKASAASLKALSNRTQRFSRSTAQFTQHQSTSCGTDKPKGNIPKSQILSESEPVKQQSSTDLSVLHFANSNHPVEVLRDHFTTYSKCCPRHDIQNIVVIASTCPASEALGPKRRYSSIKDLRKEERHSQLNLSSSLSREDRSGATQPLPQQNQTMVSDSPVTATRHKEKVSMATIAMETAAGTMPEATHGPTLTAEGVPSLSQRLRTGAGGLRSSSGGPSERNHRSDTDNDIHDHYFAPSSHHSSLPELVFTLQHSNSQAFRSAHQHTLSVAEQREHKDHIRTAAELLHAQKYQRIFSLAYEGRPPPNLPPETHVAYVFITGLAYYKLGNNKDSLSYFQQCLRLAEEYGREGDVTLSCIYIGDIEFAQRNYLAASEQYQRALHHYSRDTVARDFRMILPTQSALCAKRGSALKNASKVVDAIAAYEEAIARAESKKDKLSAHTSLGNLFQSVGENARAVTEYEHSIQLATDLQDFVSLGWAHGNMGNAYLGLYQRDKALYHLEKSLELTYDHEPTPQAIGRAYNNLGTAYQSLSELEKAEEYYDLSLSQAIYGNDIPGQARVYGNIGNLLMIKNEKRNFLQRDAPSTAPTAPKPLFHGPQFEDCEPEYRPPFIPKSIEKYYVQGTKDLDFVIKHHEESLHSIKGSPKGLSLSVSLFETNSRTFHQKQDCLMNMGKFEEALLTAEQSRARTLGELLLKRRGDQLEQQLMSPPSLEQLKAVVARQDCPVVYLSYTGARLLGWVFCPSPSQPSLNMFEVPLSDSEFDGKSIDYHLRYILNEALVEKNFEMYKPFKYDEDQNDPVLKLYDLVAKPVMTMLEKLQKDAESADHPPKKAQKIIIIPDSYTNLLPMTCLLDRSGGKFWGDNHCFQIMPSLLTMGILDQLPTVSMSVPVEHQQMLCVVGNPTIPMFTYNGEEWNLGKLPHATKEAEWVSHILNCTPILHEQATKNAVMMRLMNAKVIHLATHGSAAAGFLAFAGMSSSFNETVDAKQVLIYPEEIEGLSITPALVVLSSCDSGRGVVKADGIQGMAHAFILAGAQAVLTTLWRIPDESACVFMQFFYQFLVDGLRGTEALHKAILSVRCFSKYSQYIHWSGYQLTGREIQFSINRSSSATELTARLGNHSIFPQLEIVKQLETAFLNNPRLPTDVQVLLWYH